MLRLKLFEITTLLSKYTLSKYNNLNQMSDISLNMSRTKELTINTTSTMFSWKKGGLSNNGFWKHEFLSCKLLFAFKDLLIRGRFFIIR